MILKKYNNGFTLVEMLIAMLLFAVISVMLIPNVTKNAERNLFVTQAKKVQNDVQQAFLWIISENQGSMKTACASGADARQCMRNLIAGVPGDSGIPKKLESYCSFGHDDNNDNGRKDTSNPAKQDVAYRTRNPELLKSDVDVVHICTPHYLHAPMAFDFLNHGKAVFMEKPCAISLEQFKALKEADKRNPGKLGICLGSIKN